REPFTCRHFPVERRNYSRQSLSGRCTNTNQNRYHQPYVWSCAFYIAREKGFYKAEGLIGEVIVMNRDDLILQSLVSDSIQFGNISPSAVFPARDQGLTDVKMIAGSFNGTTYSIIANAKFKTLESLKGATSAVSSLQAGS